MATAVPIIAPAAFSGGDVSFGGFKATLLGTPTASTDAATKGYVDSKGGGVVVGSGTAGRPVAPINGQAYWRTDKNFMEVWDGTNWRVQGTVVVSALTDITTPTTGQLAIHSGDNYRMWQYDGSTWLPWGLMTGQTQGGEWTNTAGSAQNLAAAATKLNFPTADTTLPNGVGISLSGGNTFSNASDGLFMIDVQLRTTAAVAGGVAIGLSTYADATLLIPPHITAAGNWGDVGVTAPIYLTSGTVFCAYFYNAGATTTVASGTRKPRIRIWKVNTVA